MKSKQSKRLIILLIVFAFLFSLGYIFLYSPKAYSFNEYTYSSSKINTNLEGTTVACISDVHLDDAKSLERFKSIIKDFNEYPVDIVFFLGDLYDEGVFNSEEVSQILKTIECKYGKFAILGDKDLKNEIQVKTLLNNGGFEVLEEGVRPLYINNTSINLISASLDTKTGKIKKQDKTFSLALSHTPDTFTSLNNKIDLQLSGHSCGGYIHLPLLGSMIKTEGAKTYTHGLYTKESSTLIISNGISAPTSFPYKIGAKNEIIMIKLKNK